MSRMVSVSTERRKVASSSNISGFGRMTWKKVTENVTTTARTFMLGNGKMTSAMVKWATCSTRRGTDTGVHGSKTTSMERALFIIRTGKSSLERSTRTRSIRRVYWRYLRKSRFLKSYGTKASWKALLRSHHCRRLKILSSSNCNQQHSSYCFSKKINSKAWISILWIGLQRM